MRARVVVSIILGSVLVDSTGQMLFPNSLLARLPKELVIEVVGHAAHLVQLDEIRHCLNETAFSTFLQLNLRRNEPLPEAAEQTDSE